MKQLNVTTNDIISLSLLTVSVFLIGLAILFIMDLTIDYPGTIGYSEYSDSYSEYLRFTFAGYSQIDDLPIWAWTEQALDAGLSQSSTYRSFMVPIQLVAAIILILVGLRLFPKTDVRN